MELKKDKELSKKYLSGKKDINYKMIAIGLLTFLGLTAITTLGLQLLWNWILPLFNVITITYWQSLGILVILGLIKGILNGR